MSNIRMPGSMGAPADAGDQQQTKQTPRWAKAKLILRLIVVISSVIATIVSLISIGFPRDYYEWTLGPPLYALPYDVLSLLWEVIELIALRIKSRGIQPVAHLVCELFLWLGGMVVAILWLSLTIPHDAYVGGHATSQWTDVIYFWSTVVLLTVMCQFVLFVLACVEVDRKRRILENNVNQILQMVGARGQNPEDTIAYLTRAEINSKKPTWPVEMPAMNTDPIEMHTEEHPLEMVGDLGTSEMPVRGEDTNGLQKYLLRRSRG